MDLKKLVKEALNNRNHDCGCGCGDGCGKIKAPILNENLAPREILSEGLKYHIDNKKPLTEHVYRAGSSNYLTRDAIKNNLINFFLTNPGERVFNPFFGSGLNNLINMNFLDTTNVEFVRKFLKDQIDQYFPFVGIEEINLVVNRESNQLGIIMKYQVENFGIQDEINITL